MSTGNGSGKVKTSVSYAIMTVIGTRTDRPRLSSGVIVSLMERAGHKLVRETVVKSDISDIQRVLRELIEDEQTQAVIISGGDGISRGDRTLEAVARFEERPIPGFGELFRILSFQSFGGNAMLSRATAFVSEGKLVFCMPGSEKAVRLALDKLIVPEIGHLVWEANK